MDLLRRAFRDICAGHTRAPVLGRSAFIKHSSHADQIDLETKREEYRAMAANEGVPTDEQRLVDLRKEGKWSDAKDQELKRAEDYVISLEEGKRKAVNMPSMVESYVKQIEAAKKECETKRLDKRVLMGLTCEIYADRELDDYYIFTSLYGDSAMTVPLFNRDEFDYYGDSQMAQMVDDYRKAMEGCSERSIKRVAMAPFFQRYFQVVGDDLAAFFGRPICSLTFNQLDLLRYGAHFRYIYGAHDVSTFPKNVMEDPDLLTDYANAAAKGREDMAKQGAYDQGAVVVGLKKQDAKVLGVKPVNPMDQIMKQFNGDVMGWAAKQGQSGG